MPKIDVASLIKWDAEENNGFVLRATNMDWKTFDRVFRDFLERGDCILVLELDDMSEIGIAPEIGEWRVATHKFGEPSIVEQLCHRPDASSSPQEA